MSPIEQQDERDVTRQAAGRFPVSDKDFEDCLGAFKAALANNRDGQASLELVFMQHLPSAPFIWRYHAAVLEHVHQLGHDPEPILRCLLRNDGRLLRSTTLLESSEYCAVFMDHLNLVSSKRMIRGVVDVLAQMAIDAEVSTTQAHDSVLTRLIEHTGQQVRFPRYKQRSSILERMYALASKLRQTDDNDLLRSHLAPDHRVRNIILSTVHRLTKISCSTASAERALFHMPRQQLLGLVPEITQCLANSTRDRLETADRMKQRRLDAAQHLDVWLQLLHRVDSKANNSNSLLKAAIFSLATALRLNMFDRHVMLTQECFFKALLLHQNIDARVPSTIDKARRIQALLADVLLQIKSRPTEYTALLDFALPLIAKYAGLTNLLRCIRTMEELELPLSTQMDFDLFLEDQLIKLRESVTDLSEVQTQTRALALQACEKLTNALSRMGHHLPGRMAEVTMLTGARQFANLLVHAKTNSALPIVFRDASTDLPLIERVGLVHQLAHHYAQDTTRTHREAWRSIYYLYKHLKSNLLPIGPLFTKAVVQISIIRPLAENRFVSARRLIWVCHLVARVEGDEVAARIENRFWEWRGNLFARAKRVYVGVGGNKHSKAHVGTMKRLKLI